MASTPRREHEKLGRLMAVPPPKTIKLRYQPLIGKATVFTVTEGVRTIVKDVKAGPVLNVRLKAGVVTLEQIAPVVGMTPAAAQAYAAKLAGVA